jgi:hypothetical protein
LPAFKNDDRPVKPLEEMTPEEFESIAASLFKILHNFYIDFISKNPVEEQKLKAQEAAFGKARDDYLETLDGSEYQM